MSDGRLYKPALIVEITGREISTVRSISQTPDTPQPIFLFGMVNLISLNTMTLKTNSISSNKPNNILLKKLNKNKYR